MAKKHKINSGPVRNWAKNAKNNGFKPQQMNDDGKPSLGGLGNVSANAGRVLGHSVKGGMTIRYEIAACSCAGENSNCFKCDGTGFYRKEVVEKFSRPEKKVIDHTRFSSQSCPSSESGFSNDCRGGGFGIREKGRFSSAPHYEGEDI